MNSSSVILLATSRLPTNSHSTMPTGWNSSGPWIFYSGVNFLILISSSSKANNSGLGPLEPVLHSYLLWLNFIEVAIRLCRWAGEVGGRCSWCQFAWNFIDPWIQSELYLDGDHYFYLGCLWKILCSWKVYQDFRPSKQCFI